MVTRTQTHHGALSPVYCSTRPLTMKPYKPYMAAWTAQ